ncbi:Flagellar hook-associated protein FlgK [Neorhizobium galegae bv. officinalis]|uniref:Flagellar hook-associated protein 1 n=1 Tax=Neorhizobium galegae bv. officinalis TaxID=323656 RepID=A0A0T7F9Q6_NEOGA|nr:flagellar hook-associated protein FlgK [Neorhizobium galegae]CDZ31691.1 Flagellar hook-associated protein FlgK [Neorhizobium galegae bv. officinalis]
MSLASALSTAQSIFTNSGTQSAVSAKNIANAQNPDYTRRSAMVVTGGNGAIIGDITRSHSEPLLRQTIASSSIASGQRTVLDGLTEIKNLMGGNNNELSPAKLIAAFRNNLDAFAGKANDTGIGIAFISSARDVAAGLNIASDKLQQIRKDADDQIKQNVTDLNALLAKFETVNNQVKNAVSSGTDPNDSLDERDGLVKKISEIVGVTSYTRGGNDMVLYTTDGTTLFEAVPRKVTFQQTAAFDAATNGNGVYIDGVALKAGDSGNTTAKGSLQAHMQIRDKIAPTFQSQLDEIARGLITSFAETGPTGALLPMTGLFTYKDAAGVQQTAIPPAGTIVPGLASKIFVNPVVVPPAGTPDKVRDGGINGLTYIVNTGGSSYGDLLDKYNQNLTGPMVFDTDTEIADAPDVLSFAADSMGWLEQLRSTATAADETKTAMLSRSLEAFSSNTGVSLDEELSLLLDIEQSYKAGAKLMSTVDDMMKALLDIAS